MKLMVNSIIQRYGITMNFVFSILQRPVSPPRAINSYHGLSSRERTVFF